MSFLRRVGPVSAIFLGFWLLLMIGGRSKLLRDPGTFWHTSVGEIILKDGFFEGDPFTFTHAGSRWVPHQWLGEVVMALVHRIGGFDSYLVLAATILSALFTWLTVRILRTGLHPVLALLVVLVAFATGALQFHVRPLLLTMVFLTLVTAALVGYDAGRISLTRLFWLVPVFVIWTNTHGGVIGGFATLAVAWLGWTVARPLGWPSPFRSHRDSGVFLILTLLCGLTAFANPYGWEIPRAWLHIMRGPKLSDLIEEHKRLDPTDLEAWPLFAFAAIYFFVLVGLRERPRISWLLPILWLVQAFFRVRHAPLFALAGTVAIAEMWPRTRWAERLASRRPDLYDPVRGRFSSPVRAWLLPLAFVAAVLFVQSRGIVAPVVGRGWAEFDRKITPVELIPILKQHEPRAGEPNRLFNSCNLGGFAIYHVPGYKVFIDDRVELYGEDYFETFVRAELKGRAAAAMATWEREYGAFDFALVSPQGDCNAVLRNDPGWELLGKAPAALFYRRKK